MPYYKNKSVSSPARYSHTVSSACRLLHIKMFLFLFRVNLKTFAIFFMCVNTHTDPITPSLSLQCSLKENKQFQVLSL